ncbi:unnamed protein product [Ceratitis capitata]|uniref:(Mediterranean fruit fly) hypothetical protein n=1 Tax=Ceratitis capitata TaxID=7213 RepID=A0A811UI38_CERCA|nr:unnamed protein product [Ceratitis capitata]
MHFSNNKSFNICNLMLLLLSLSISFICAGKSQLKARSNADSADRNFRILATRIKCTHTVPESISGFQCHLKQRNNHTYSSGWLVFRKSISKLEASAILDIYRTNGQRVNIFNITLDCCALLAKGKHEIKILDNMLRIMYAAINERPRCPLRTNFNYTISDFYVNESILPAYIPKTNFRAGLYIRSKGRPAAQVVAEGKIVNSN